MLFHLLSSLTIFKYMKYMKLYLMLPAFHVQKINVSIYNYIGNKTVFKNNKPTSYGYSRMKSI